MKRRPLFQSVALTFDIHAEKRVTPGGIWDVRVEVRGGAQHF
jgi:hypothetical protein